MQCPITGEPNCKCKYEIKPIFNVTSRETLRKLFTDHANYTHLYIINEIYRLPTLSLIKSRLLDNQTDIGTAAGLFLGEKYGNELTKLLTQHIIDASAVVKSAIIGNKDITNSKIDALFDNSTRVALFLGSIKPNQVGYDEFKLYFDQHNQYVIDITTQYLLKNYTEVITTYDCYYNHMMMFSDLVLSVL